MQPQTYILIGEDDPDDVLLLRKALTTLCPDMEIDVQRNGEQVLKRLGDSTPPALVILDLNMPILDGRKVMAVMQTHIAWKTIPVVVFSTSTQEADRRRSIELGAREFISKPNTLRGYIEALRPVLNTVLPLTVAEGGS